VVKSTRRTPLQTLLAIAAHDPAVDPVALEEVLRLVHAPNDLEGTAKVAQNLCLIVQAAIASKKTTEPARFERYRNVLQWLEQNVGVLAPRLFSGDADSEARFLRTKGKHPILGRVAEKHGLWTLLWEDGPDEFRVLQLRATLSHIAVMQYWTTRPHWDPHSRSARGVLRSLCDQTRAIRHFVMDDYKGKREYQEVLRELAKHPESDPIPILQSVLARYRPARRDDKPKSIYTDLCAIVWLLQRATHPQRLRQPIQPTTTKTSTEYELDRSPTDNVDQDPDDDEDDLDDEDGEEGESPSSSVETAVYRRHHWTAKEVDDCLDSGTHPEDALPRQSIHLSHRKSGARAGSGWAAMKNHLFLWSPDEIPLELIADGMQILAVAAENGNMGALTLYARALVVLRLGESANAVRGLVVCSDAPSQVTAVTFVLPCEAKGRGEWVLPALPLRLRSQGPHPGCLNCSDHFVLPDYTALSSILRKLIDLQSGGRWKGDPIQPFDKPSLDLDHELRDCFNRNETLRKVFTFSRLAEVRFRRTCQDAHGCVVPATYLTGREHDTGEVTRFYVTLPIATLQDLDRKSVRKSQNDLQKLGFASSFDPALKPSSSAGHVGSPFCPTTKGLEDFFRELRKKIERVNSELLRTPDLACRIRRHNLFVTYTYAGFNLGTGHRANVGGYADPKQVQLRDGLVGFRDKGQRGRLVPISALVYAQMCACREYLKTVDFVGNVSLPFYLLDNAGKAMEIAPSSLKQYLPFVPNFGRHYVCSALTELVLRGDDRIKVEYLKEFMGHAAEGEDRASPHSAFDYRGYAHSMRDVLDEVVKGTGYWPIDISGHELAANDFEVERLIQA